VKVGHGGPLSLNKGNAAPAFPLRRGDHIVSIMQNMIPILGLRTIFPRPGSAAAPALAA